LIGIVSARSVRVFKRRGLIELSLTGVLGIIVASIAFVTNLTVAPIAIAIGATASFLRLITISWFQERAESGLLGRVMSLAMFSAVALDPISFALAGILVGINLTAMFVGAGALLLYYGDAGSGEPYDARSGLGQRVFCGGVIEERLSDGRTCDPGPPPYL